MRTDLIDVFFHPELEQWYYRPQDSEPDEYWHPIAESRVLAWYDDGEVVFDDDVSKWRLLEALEKDNAKRRKKR